MEKYQVEDLPWDQKHDRLSNTSGLLKTSIPEISFVHRMAQSWKRKDAALYKVRGHSMYQFNRFTEVAHWIADGPPRPPSLLTDWLIWWTFQLHARKRIKSYWRTRKVVSTTRKITSHRTYRENFGGSIQKEPRSQKRINDWSFWYHHEIIRIWPKQRRSL